MSKKIKDTTKMQDKNYLAKDFSSFRSDLVRYAKNYFSEQNNDFSEGSLGGMFVELAAYVGDSMTFFLDHQFNELNPDTATEQRNIEAHARNAGLKIFGASPAAVDLEIFMEVTATQDLDGTYIPASTELPTVLEGSEFKSATGVTFSITEDVDFNERGPDGEYLANITTSAVDGSGNPVNFILTRTVGAVSGLVYTERFPIGSSKPFRTISLTNRNVSEVISVTDDDENTYYEVDYLTQDTAFKRTKNLSSDVLEVPSILEVVSAARRFTLNTSFATATATLTFGGGDESINDNDAIPDPSKLALPLYGRTTFQRFSIDPQNLLKTKTLGTAPANTTLTVKYRAGGGKSHNVSAGSINQPVQLRLNFPSAASALSSSRVTNSIGCINQNAAAGGLNKLTISELRQQIAASRNQQARIVTQDDLLARVYSMPSPFGKVYRAAIRKSSRNPLASELYVICKNRSNKLTVAPDSLKKNLSTYLNEYRLISDAIDVLDVTVVNYGIEFSVVVTPESNKSSVIAAVQSEINRVAGSSNYQIDQPLIKADFINAIINTPGVMALDKLIFFNLHGGVADRSYSNYPFDMESNEYKGMIVGPAGSIFEMRYSKMDIVGRAE
jgi:hypothetical protein